MPPDLVGTRARLRAPRPDDLPFLLRFANDPDLRGWLRFVRPMDEASESAWLADLLARDAPTWLITRPDDDAPLGVLALDDLDAVAGAAELGIALLDAGARGRGLGEDAMRLLLDHAFTAMRLQRVWLRVHSDNPARRLYARLGLREEGTMRRHVWKRGAFRDVVLMGILREEWTS